MSSLRIVLAAFFLCFCVSVNAQEAKIVSDAKTSANWIAQALSASGYKADFSPLSLKEVDRFFDEQSDGGRAKPGGLLSTDFGPRIFAIGSYIGEVLRRSSGGEWQGDDSDPEAEINISLRLKNGTQLWPVQRAMKRFKNGKEDSIYPYGIAATKK